MPSGSGGRGGGGGSHFGGGGGHGGSHGGGHGSGGGRANRPISFAFFGRRYYVPTGKSNLIRVLLLACVFTLFLFVIKVGDYSDLKKDVRTIVNDRNRYISMIDNAKANPTFTATGRIINISYNSSAGKYYFDYSIDTIDGWALTGYTYSVYSKDDISKFHVGQTLTFAVDSVPVTRSTDSINFGYEDIPLSADGEYAHKTQDLRQARMFMVFSGVTSAIIFIAAACIFIKFIKTAKDQIENVGKTPDQNERFSDKKPTARRCEYCGSVISDGSDKCPNCGASIKK